MAAKGTKRVYTAVERAELIESYKQSGKPQSQWCSENGVTVSALQKWLVINNKARKSNEEVQAWASVAVESHSKVDRLQIQAGIFSITVEKSTDLELLTAVLRAVAEVC